MSGPTKGMVAGQQITTGAQTKEFDEGYERVFGHDRKPQRGRFRYDAEAGQCVEVGADWTDAERRAATATEEIVYGNTQATDGTDLSSRKKHREYMKQNGLAMVSDFKEHWQTKKKERENFHGPNGTNTKRIKESVAQAFHKLRKP